jgi:hypothetical protein
MNDYMEPKLIACAMCGVQFDASLRNRGKGIQRFCSQKCRQQADNRRHYQRKKPSRTQVELQRTCAVCGVGFTTDAYHPSALTCSQACNQARMSLMRREQRAKNALIPKACEECGETYTPNLRTAHRQRYCSTRCLNRATQRAFYKKSRGTVTTRLGTKEWKAAAKAAIERDGGKCRLCHASDRRLNVHHLFHRTDAERHDHSEENLVTLCNVCHSKIHDIKVGRLNGEVVISGAVFALLNVESVKIVQ